MKEIVTGLDLFNSFCKTHMARNNQDIHKIMSDEAYTIKFNAIYYLIENLKLVKVTNLSVLCLHSNSGVRDYMLLYKVGEYHLIIERMVIFGQIRTGSFQEKTIGIKSLNDLAEILNEAIDKIRL